MRYIREVGEMNYSVGDSVFVLERVSGGTIYEWEGEVVRIEKDFVETKHHRNALTHPQWMNYARAYSDTWTRHFGEMINIRWRPKKCDVIEHALSERGGFVCCEVSEKRK